MGLGRDRTFFDIISLVYFYCCFNKVVLLCINILIYGLLSNLCFFGE